jgi:integrase/recombinase XerD
MTSTRSAEAISPLRRRMIEDMSVRKFGEKTQHDYIRHIENFARFLGRSPDTATGEDLRRYQVHQTATGAQPPSVNSSAVALRFLFTVTLGRANLATQLTRVHYPRRLPRVLSPEEVARLLEAAPGPGLKYKAALSVAYGAGLRASEVVSLKVCDIDSKRLLIRVEQGKSLPPRRRGAARTVTPCCRRNCSRCCARGGGSAGRRAGCSRGAIRSCP